MQMLLRRAIFLFLVILPLAALSQELKVEKYKLKNGMTVILHEDHSLPMATVNIWYYVGAKDEPERRSGFAHLFEHLMFMGTERVPGGQFDQIMERFGGSNNATTSSDRTNYFSIGPSNLLPMLLWLDADRLEDLGRMMDQKKLDLQREVVRNERREGLENTPYGAAYEAINQLMFPKGHPYHTGVIGTHEDLEAATVKDVQEFFSNYYVPNNASLVVAGDFKSEEIKPLIERWFGTIPRGNDPIHRTAPPVDLRGVKRTTMVDNVQYPKTVMVWHSPAFYKPGDAEMDLAASILTDGITSRLYDRLVVKDRTATDVSAFQESRYLGSLFYIDATPVDEAAQPKVETAIDEVLRDFLGAGPTSEELNRQKAKLEFRHLSTLQSLRAKADQLNEFEFYLGEPNSFKAALDRYRNATPASVRAAAQKTLSFEDRLILRVIPRGDEPDQNPRDAKPEVGIETGFTPPLPKEATLSNGIKLFYWQRPELPLMSVSALFRGGANHDPADKAGLAAMTASMLDEGTAALNAREFRSAMDALGARFAATADNTATAATLSVIEANFGKALSLFADAVSKPRFDPVEWERVQRLSVAGLEQALDDPQTIASLIGMREFFGPSHPYGRPVSGTPATVRNLAISDVHAAYTRMFNPKGATLFAAGSLPLETVRNELERTLGKWSSTAQALPAITYPEPANQKLRVLIVDRPGSPQTTVRFYLPGRPFSDPARERLEALSTILGGTFTSRLNANLREDKGYTYGAGARFVFDPSVGYFTAVSDVRTDVTGASLREFLAEFAKIRTGDITEEEAQRARSTMRASTVETVSSLESVIGTAMELYLNGKTFSELSNQLRSISQLRPEGINALASGALDLEKGVLVLVGDRGEIEKQLQGLDLPKPEIVSMK